MCAFDARCDYDSIVLQLIGPCYYKELLLAIFILIEIGKKIYLLRVVILKPCIKIFKGFLRLRMHNLLLALHKLITELGILLLLSFTHTCYTLALICLLQHILLYMLAVKEVRSVRKDR
jgi:hypothetical protein